MRSDAVIARIFAKEEERAMLAQGNPIMTKANQVMDIFYLDEQERKQYEAAWEYESDRLSMISESERKGRELGIAEGSRQARLETARILKQLGDSTQKIVQATGLTQAEGACPKNCVNGYVRISRLEPVCQIV